MYVPIPHDHPKIDKKIKIKKYIEDKNQKKWKWLEIYKKMDIKK